ncbi:MAG: DNA repair protein RecO [Bacteroidota bacterium]
MLVKTKAIVLTSIKFGEADLIVKCYTLVGVKSYLLKGVLKSKSKKINAAYFQPLTILNLTANHNYKGNLNYIKEARISFLYQTISTDIYKQTIAIFLSEVLANSLQEEDSDPALFSYLETALQWLDTHDRTANFHLLFMFNLTKLLGFYPEVKNKDAQFFDLQEGCFTDISPKFDYISGEKLNSFKSLIGTNFDVIHQLKFNANSRQSVLESLIVYYELHLPGFRRPKSLEILKEIFR